MIYQYKQYKSSNDLSHIIDCFWSFRADTEYLSLPRRPVIPDACVDLIWSVDNPGTPCRLTGPMTEPFFSDNESLFGIRFKPFVPAILFGLPLTEFIDQKPPTADIDSIFIKDSICGRIDFSGMTTDGIISQLETAVRAKIPDFDRPEIRTIAALEQMKNFGGSVEDFSRDIGWSRQHLNRKCRELSGLSPKFLMKIFRLQHAIKSFDTEPDFAAMAAGAGYFDQSHMIRDFRRLTSLSPSEYFSNQMLQLYNS